VRNAGVPILRPGSSKSGQTRVERVGCGAIPGRNGKGSRENPAGAPAGSLAELTAFKTSFASSAFVRLRCALGRPGAKMRSRHSAISRVRPL
jgi:hypothetical protein